MAADACKKGKVKIEGSSVKPSYTVTRGEVVHVKKEGFNLQYKVVDLIEKRVSATLAQPCYENITPEEELNKFRDWFSASPQIENRLKGTGRPTKKERRAMDKFKNEF